MAEGQGVYNAVNGYNESIVKICKGVAVLSNFFMLDKLMAVNLTSRK
jgi:hypothetical protein